MEKYPISGQVLESFKEITTRLRLKEIATRLRLQIATSDSQVPDSEALENTIATQFIFIPSTVVFFFFVGKKTEEEWGKRRKYCS